MWARHTAVGLSRRAGSLSACTADCELDLVRGLAENRWRRAWRFMMYSLSCSLRQYTRSHTLLFFIMYICSTLHLHHNAYQKSLRGMCFLGIRISLSKFGDSLVTSGTCCLMRLSSKVLRCSSWWKRIKLALAGEIAFTCSPAPSYLQNRPPSFSMIPLPVSFSLEAPLVVVSAALLVAPIKYHLQISFCWYQDYILYVQTYLPLFNLLFHCWISFGCDMRWGCIIDFTPFMFLLLFLRSLLLSPVPQSSSLSILKC